MGYEIRSNGTSMNQPIPYARYLRPLGGALSYLGGDSSIGTGLGDVGSGLGIYNALQSGTPQGKIAAGANAAKLAGQTGIFGENTGAVNTGATSALDALAMYQGLKQGGVGGYGQALGAGLQGAGTLLNNPALSTAGGYVLAPLAVYNAANNWKSGATGSDALQGAEAGAAVGSIIPGIGTLIGGLAGGAIGALSSAFGGGATDPETKNWSSFINATGGANATPGAVEAATRGMSPQSAFNLLSGVMDIKNNRIPFVNSFGRMGETNVLNDMTGQINSALSSGKLAKNATPEQIYSQVVNPWLNQRGASITPTTGGLQLQDVLTNLIGDWQKGQLTSKTPLTATGSMDTTLSAYGAPSAPTQATPTNFRTDFPMRSSPYTRLAAEGGSMKSKKSGLSSLREIYEGPSFGERQNFQDGGSAYGSYYSSPPTYSSYTAPTPSYTGSPPSTTDSNSALQSYTPTGAGSNYAPVNMPNGGSYDPNTGLMIDAQGNVTSVGSGGMGPINLPNGSAFDPNTGLMIDAQGNVTGGGSSGGSGGGDQHTIPGDLQNALRNIGGQNGIQGLLKALGAIAPVIGGAIRSPTNIHAPTAAPGMTQGATAPKPSTFNRTQVASPSNLPGGGPMSTQDWYTYGSRPEAQFFQNNAVPLNQATGLTGQAKGGRQSALSELGGDFGMPEFDSSVEHHVNGPGDGTSDDIPAQLSDGEYVMDAPTVSLLGNGSNKAGAARLDQLRENVRKHAAKPMSKGKQFMKAKPPEQYIGGKAKEKK